VEEVLDTYDAMLLLNGIETVGTKKFLHIREVFHGDIGKIFHESPETLRDFYKFSPKSIERITSPEIFFDLAEEKRRMEDFEVRFLYHGSEFYPESLRDFSDAPIGIYVRGEIPPMGKCISIVGSRQCTFYGEKIAQELAYELASLGYCIVSGLAIGIDMAAHCGALRANGKTLAVLPGGIDRIYPKENQSLYEKIYQNGTLLSESRFGRNLEKWSFRQRNRIISGLSVATIVVETPLCGGSMISAESAKKQGRLLMAIPGPINSQLSKGCHRLIQEGAILIGGVEDVIAAIQSPHYQKQVDLIPVEGNILRGRNCQKIPVELDATESKIWEILCAGSQSIDELANHIGCDTLHCAQMVQMMTVCGYLERDTAGMVSLR
jgi:DNA processing protein